MQIKLEHLTKRFGDTIAVNDLSITLESGKLIALLGPSGCGKTTTLNMISGILPVSGGSIFFDDRDVTSLPPEKRGIGLVFQNYALYPHMTVLQNICFPMEIQRIPKKERIRRAEELAEMVHITPYLKRKPAELSGGQQQRVAIARALSKRPDVLLLDEPLSNLDAKLRVEMREEIRRIQREAGITTVFVTHDQEEALSMSDTVVVMDNGVIQQIGTPEDIYNEPKNAFVADFIGESNILDGIMREDYLAEFSGHRFSCLDKGFQKNEPVDVVVRPEDVDVVPVEQGMLSGTVTSVTFKGVHFEIIVDIGGFKWMIQSTDHQSVGSEIGLSIDPDAIHIMKKSAYSGAFGDYSSFSDEIDHLSDIIEEEA